MGLLRYIQINYRGIFRSFYFLVALIVVLVFLPREGRFKYEFQKGKPWMHKDLYAPFDFPVYKTDAEIFTEKASILKGFKPFFRHDSLVQEAVIQQFFTEIRPLWISHINNNRLNSRYNQSQLNVIFGKFEKEITTAFNNVYKKGIIDQSESIQGSTKTDMELSILKNNVSYDNQYSDVYTRKKASEYVNAKIKAFTSSESSTFKAFWYGVDAQKYIQPNLLYDDYITQKYKNELISNVSLTKGLIQSGERIISQNEMVTSDVYQVLESLKREYETHISNRNWFVVMLGNALLVGALFIILYLFLLSFRTEILKEDSKTLFILLLIAFMVAISSYVIKSGIVSIYVIPLVIVPIFIRTFFDARLALFIHLVTIFVVGFFVPNSFEYVFTNFIAGVVAILSLTNLYRRGRLFITVAFIYLSYVIIYLSLVTIEDGTPFAANGFVLLWYAINALLLMASYQLVYLFEKIFGFLSDATLVELSDTNLDLLRKLAEVAPGTFQHSLQVANLAEAAIQRIGGNPLLVRAGALYHDIGKTVNPLFYIENQPFDFNPHKNLDFTESAKYIISHVTEGVKIANKAGLPQQIVDFIQTHHGTSKVKYFYKLHRDKFDNGVDDVHKFTYPGPRPNSKETAIVMMADAVEAASRSMKNITLQNIDELVESIIDKQQLEGQFNDADITFRDITTIKTVFKKKLINIYHARIEYPDNK
ncbi:MAG: HDIG domain-containing protein [Bacteroidales bacterium]|nr:MAG: HDIG domain-containing protein [Bacteroidales bacterium]